MAMHERHFEELITRYIKGGDTIAVGTSKDGETLLKKLALYEEGQEIKVRVVPTSFRLAEIASSLGLEITSMNTDEVDIAVEFADQIDEQYNYIKRDSTSLVRDKMIAQSAETLIVIANEENYAKVLRGSVPFEIATFGWKRTLIQLEALGKAKLRKQGSKIYKTETTHYLVDVEIDSIYSAEDLDYSAKSIPGVLESGLFIGYADKLLLHNKRVRVESRV
jgi:ribose 5-phosphate isomerase A